MARSRPRAKRLLPAVSPTGLNGVPLGAGSIVRRRRRCRLRCGAGTGALLAGLPVAIGLVGERTDGSHAAELQRLTADLATGFSAEEDGRQAAGQRAAAGSAAIAATAGAALATLAATLAAHELIQ